MKRSECTVESLKALGYSAKVNYINAWRYTNDEKDCNAKQSKELFDCVVNIVKNGGAVEIRKNNFNYTVNVLVEEAKHEFRGTEIIYYLSRPMTEAERIEADLYTGRNK
jgi:hypothetical protein